MKDYKNYKRFPIELGPSNIILIHLFSNSDKLRDAFENIDMWEENKAVFDYDVDKNAAKQFFEQLEGHYCDNFLKEIILEASRLLKESDIKLNEMDEKVKNIRPNFLYKKSERAKEALDEAYKQL